jgi:pimeloyl-ACP methyl ester carboxylesterase
VRRHLVSVAVVVLTALCAFPAHASPVRGETDPAAPGPFSVQSTTTVGPCVGPVADQQTRDNRRDHVRAPIQCTGAFPIGRGPDTGVDFYFPRDATSPRPLVVFNGGYGANPGFFARIAKHWAGHGYVVAVSYQYGDLSPNNLFAGVRRSAQLDADPRSPLHGRIDMRSIVLAGHSFGATNALHAADLLGLARQGLASTPAFTVPAGSRVVAILAIAPAVSTITDAVSLPSLTVSGTDDIVSPPADVRRSFSGITRAPAWFAVFDRGTHLSTLDEPAANPQIGLETAFLDFVTTGARCDRFAGAGWPGDARVVDAARNAKTREIDCSAKRSVQP